MSPRRAWAKLASTEGRMVVAMGVVAAADVAMVFELGTVTLLPAAVIAVLAVMVVQLTRTAEALRRDIERMRNAPRRQNWPEN